MDKGIFEDPFTHSLFLAVKSEDVKKSILEEDRQSKGYGGRKY